MFVSSHHPCLGPGRHSDAGQFTRSIDEILSACIRNDPIGVRGQLDTAVSTFGLGECIDNVLLPAMRQIGIRWQRDGLAVDSERLTTETVRGWLESFRPAGPEPSGAATLLLACGPSDQHSIGLEALGLLLRSQQQSCRLLGPRTSVRALAVAAVANQPSAIVVVSHLMIGRLGAIQALQGVTGLGAQLFYAGGAFPTGRHRHRVPGTYLGTNLQAACATILAAITDAA
jgi:MerR family transcriptional regulator, light-induced transcriptional regulator